ncbi:MAG: heavy-metal-associated domain-containing protein [Candidatus Aquicultorales bacterium]
MGDKQELVEDTLQVRGLDCPDCAAKVGSAIRGIDGVVEADINFSASTLTLAYDPLATDRDRIVKAVESFGYEVALPQRSRLSVFRLSGVD